MSATSPEIEPAAVAEEVNAPAEITPPTEEAASPTFMTRDVDQGSEATPPTEEPPLAKPLKKSTRLKPQAYYDMIVVGAGLAGLMAGVLSARQGLRALVLARGIGGTHVGNGTVDVWGYDTQRQVLTNPQTILKGPRQKGLEKYYREHPLARAGEAALQNGVSELQAVCTAAGYPLLGELTANFILPTALGAPRPTCLAPRSFVAGDLRRTDEITLARFAHFRDWFADLAAANLRTAGYTVRVVDLPLPNAPTHRDAFSTDLARLFDRADYRAQVAEAWREGVIGATRLGVPAILGLEHAAEAHHDLEARLGIEIFEIPTLPPSVPGMRLFNVLRSTLEQAGGRLVLGPSLSAWIEEGQALGVTVETANGERHYAADFIILASGGARHGGLESPAAGRMTETVFNLPLETSGDWFAPLYWSAHPLAYFGARVNARMQPIDAQDQILYPNVLAVGGVLAGADRLTEGSREGIDLATAWKAVAQLPVPVVEEKPVSKFYEYEEDDDLREKEQIGAGAVERIET